MASNKQTPRTNGKGRSRRNKVVRPRVKVERPLLEHSISSHVRPGQVIVLCAEPGMCLEDVVTQVLELAANQGASTYAFDFGGCGPEGFCDRMVKAVRRINSCLPSYAWSVAAFEGVPDLDEAQVRRCVRAINRLTDKGGCALLTMLPEAYQLVESLPTALIFRADDLLLSDASGTGSVLEDRAKTLCGGIPYLAVPLLSVDPANDYVMRRDYVDALSDLIHASLRDGLLPDEVELRLVMLLLGKGTFADLDTVMKRVELDFLAGLQRDAPLFGVDVASATFSCTGLASDAVFRACAHVLVPVTEQYDKACADVAQLLLVAGNVRRGSEVLALCTNAMRLAEIGCAWFADLLDVGAVDVARNALAAAKRLMVATPAMRSACELALELLGGSHIDELACRRAIGSQHESSLGPRNALMAAARLVAANGWHDFSAVTAAKGDRLAMRLMTHASALGLLAEGHPCAAYRRLFDVVEAADGASISGFYLATDLALMRAFVCDCDSEALQPDASYSAMECIVVNDYSLARALPQVSAVMLGGARTSLAAYTVAAERSGMKFIQAGLLVLDALSSARRGEGVRAHVQSEHADSIATALEIGWLGETACLVDWAVRFSMGEAPTAAEMSDRAFSRPFLSEVRQVMIAVVRGSEYSAGSVSGRSVDRDFLWLLVALSSGIDGFSERFISYMPDHWVSSVEAVQSSWAQTHGLLTLDDGSFDKPDESAGPSASGTQRDGHRHVSVSLLGRMTVCVDGVAIDDRLLDQRRLRAYISQLASAPAHKVTLFQLIEAIWPEYDFEVGNQRLYGTATALNKALRSVGYTRPIAVRSRADSSVALDTTSVSVDVDEFERAARDAVLNEGNDPLVLSCAERAERLYGGDLYVSQYDASQFVAMRRDELRRLYVDAMVAGSEAARRLGNGRAAIRLAERAVCIDDLREDAFSCFMESLVETGRVAEAQDSYKRYVLRCVDTLHRPPSHRIIEAARRASVPFDRYDMPGIRSRVGVA